MKTKERIEADILLLCAAMRAVLEAVDTAKDQGIFDDLNHCDDAGAFWHDAIDQAEAALKTAEDP